MRAREVFSQLITVVAVGCAVITTGFVVRREMGANANPANPNESAPELVENWSETKSSGHRIGSLNATVTIVEFADFECPACRRFATVTLPAILRKYGDDVALVYRHWPLEYHRFAYPSARASECAAAQGRFTEFHDLLFAKQDSLGLKSYTSFAEESEVPDLKAFEACVSQTGLLQTITEDIEEVTRIGGKGTPTLVINGMRLPSTPDSTRLSAMIDAELAKRSAPKPH